MGFIALKCPQCGADLNVEDNRDFMFCSYCGSKVTVEKQIVELQGSVTVDGIASADVILDRANIFLSNKEYDRAREYFDKALGIQVKEDIWGRWFEIKARRDLWIHNGGIVNQIYLDKAKEYVLCDLGKEAIISDDYFKECVVLLKTMVGRIDREIRNTYISEE